MRKNRMVAARLGIESVVSGMLLLALWGMASCSDAVPAKSEPLPDGLEEAAPEIVFAGEPEGGAEVVEGEVYDGICTTGEECESGLCVDGPDGRVCAQPCDLDGCPAGYACRGLAISGPDPISICLPDEIPFCRPCRQDEDCMRYFDDQESFCRWVGPEGAFCTTSCAEDRPCPKGYECGDAGHCEPEGECDCTSFPSNVGYETTCEVSNGLGVCSGTRFCAEDGLTACDAPLPAKEACDSVDNDCDGKIDEEVVSLPCQKANQFGACDGMSKCVSGEAVCQAQEPMAETCDGQDNNCDGEIDEPGAAGCVTAFQDLDGDGFGSLQSLCSCKPVAGYVSNSLDCNDQDASQSPNGNEVCDGKDNNCDSVVDEKCDLDGDGWCGKPFTMFGPEYVCAHGEIDCNDFDATIHPTAAELCDGKDNNCDSVADEKCDLDGDGWCGKPALVFGGAHVCKHSAVDCKDQDAEVHPEAAELCNFVDDDCDGNKDESCDADKDGFCAGPIPATIKGCQGLTGIAASLCVKQFQEQVCPKGFLDCDDGDALVHPKAPEVCDDKDNDCNKLVDEGVDQDGDGWCLPAADVGKACLACPNGTTDCNDNITAVHPGAEDAPDLSGIDSNCDGVDGDAAICVFVDGPSGKDFFPGTPKQPKATLAAALAEAAASPSRNCILLSLSSVSVTNFVLPSGISLWGGYDAKSGWTVSAAIARTPFVGGSTALTIENNQKKMSVGRLAIQAAAGGTGKGASGSGGNSIGILVRNSTNVSLAALDVQAGGGGAGNSGGSGSPGLNGFQGEAGMSWCEPHCVFTGKKCGTQASGAEGPGKQSCGGGGGLNVMWTAGPLQWDMDVAAEYGYATGSFWGWGTPSCCFMKKGPASGGTPGKKGPEEAGDGYPGQDGVAGSPGSPGSGGQGLPEMTEKGIVALTGGTGGTGGDGCGGGGGGWGDNWDSFLSCEQWGGGGGGGGSGGTGGTGGLGGKGGGSSVALMTYKSKVDVVFSILKGGKGGTGGSGGSGG
ncbi:MAG: hypothetical protein FJ109_15650, partial [Deltaproteobacteria bacterium]|nr:hypothetical protein [Deltaproteobacteria bacterium]